jgi:predicted NBD/HSP70 family sugar kinase
VTQSIRRSVAGSSIAEAPARQESLRALNLALVFRQIVAASSVGAAQAVSRTELAETTGLTRPTISRIVDELIGGKLVAEAGLAHDGRAGRPRVGLTLSREGPAGLGLDIRPDGLAACVADLTGTVRHLTFAPAAQPYRPARILADLAKMARTAVREAAAERLTVVGVTLAAPGPVESGRIVRVAPALGWRNVDAGTKLRQALHRAPSSGELPVSVENEANLAALGELHAGGNDATSFVYVSGSLGLGAGIVLDGKLMRGAHGWSGELGHVTVDPRGNPCPCGATGCLQTYASLEAILNRPATGATPAAAISDLADAGDPAVLASLDTAASALGVALSNLVNLLDIDTVLLGGSYSILASWLTERIQAEMRRRILTAAWSPIEVRPALLGPDAAVIGAALRSVDTVWQSPWTWLAQNRIGG